MQRPFSITSVINHPSIHQSICHDYIIMIKKYYYCIIIRSMSTIFSLGGRGEGHLFTQRHKIVTSILWPGVELGDTLYCGDCTILKLISKEKDQKPTRLGLGVGLGD